MMVREEQAVSTGAVRAELARILASPRFDASERNRHFLSHVVEEALAGRTERIKAYTIATEVFGRDPKFEPQLDSIVRIEAGRLRRSLERYYLTDGQASRLRIDIPRGGYAPVFAVAESVALPHARAGSPRFSEALAEARRVHTPEVLYGHVAVAAAAAELGFDDEAADAVSAIRSLDPDYGAHVVADLEGRHVAPELVSPIVAALGKAGLAMPASDGAV